MKDEAKIIFPSTHVIFEGLKTKYNILENEKPKLSWLIHQAKL